MYGSFFAAICNVSLAYCAQSSAVHLDGADPAETKATLPLDDDIVLKIPDSVLAAPRAPSPVSLPSRHAPLHVDTDLSPRTTRSGPAGAGARPKSPFAFQLFTQGAAERARIAEQERKIARAQARMHKRMQPLRPKRSQSEPAAHAHVHAAAEPAPAPLHNAASVLIDVGSPLNASLAALAAANNQAAADGSSGVLPGPKSSVSPADEALARDFPFYYRTEHCLCLGDRRATTCAIMLVPCVLALRTDLTLRFACVAVRYEKHVRPWIRMPLFVLPILVAYSVVCNIMTW